MDTLARADMFFFITAIAVVLVTVCLVVLLVYVITILHQVRALVELARKEGELLSADIGELRSRVHTEGFKWAFIFAFLRKLWKRRSSSKRKGVEEG